MMKGKTKASFPSKISTLILYYVPEDKDDPDSPNAFFINLPQEEIRVSHIRDNFPMKGEYYFRFKYSTNNTIIWMDLTTDDCRIPFYNNQIFVKASRIFWSQGNEQELNPNQQFSFQNNFSLNQSFGANSYNNYMEYKEFQQPLGNSPQKQSYFPFQAQEKPKNDNNLLDF